MPRPLLITTLIAVLTPLAACVDTTVSTSNSSFDRFDVFHESRRSRENDR